MNNEKEIEVKSELEEQVQDNSKMKIERNNLYDDKIYKDFSFYSILSILYGLIFAFCFFETSVVGMNYSIYIIATITFIIILIKRNKIALKKESIFHIIFVTLLGISTCLTDNYFIHFFNSIAILLLIVIFILNQVVDTKDWGFLKYFSNLFILSFSMLGYLFYPFKHLNMYVNEKIKGKRNNEKFKNIIIGMVIGIPLLFIIITLLSSADQIFSNVFRNIFEKIVIPEKSIIFIFMLFIGFIAMYTLACTMKLKEFSKESVIEKKEAIIAITFTSALAFIYIMFCGIQIIYLFAGGVYRLPENFTYAEYARKGFFELLVVSIINFIMIIICVKKFYTSKILNIILTIISICNFILILSSFYRMTLYIKAYDLSFLRVLVIWFLCLLTILMIATMIYIYVHKFPFFKFVVSVVSIAYIIFAFSKPDYIVASYNISNNEEINMGELFYLMNLSQDATPALKGMDIKKIENINSYNENENPIYYSYEDPVKSLESYFKEIVEENKNGSIISYNFSRSKALKLSKEYFEDK